MQRKLLAMFLMVASLALTGIMTIPAAKAQDDNGHDYNYQEYRQNYHYRNYYDYRSNRYYRHYDRRVERIFVAIDDYRYMPRTIVIPRHTRVIWINYDRRPHTVTSTRGYFDSGRMERGERYSIRFDQRGRYNYYCRIHPQMRGTVIVR